MLSRLCERSLAGPDRQCASKRGRNQIAPRSKILQFSFSDSDIDCPLCVAVNAAVLSLAILHPGGNAKLTERVWPVLSIRYASFIRASLPVPRRLCVSDGEVTVKGLQ